MAGDTERVLALGGASARNAAENLFPDAKIDAPKNVPERGLYDVVLSYHHLQTISHRDTNKVLQEIRYRLKEEGEFHLFVPSLEWAANQILSPNPHPLLKLHLFGNQYSKDQYNYNGFTMFELRNLLHEHFAITHATLGNYTVEYEDKNVEAEQYYIRGEKK